MVPARFVMALGGTALSACVACSGGHGGGGGGGSSPTSPSTGTSGAPPTFTSDVGTYFQGAHPAPLVAGGTVYVYVNTGNAGTGVEGAADGLNFAPTPATYPAGVSRTIVPLPGAQYRMYYFATATSVDVSSAISSDGLTWLVEAGTRYSDPNIGGIRAIALPTGGYRLYYPNGVGLTSVISSDGLTFTSEGPVGLTPSDGTFTWGVSAAAYLNGQFHMVLTRTPTSTSVSELWHAASLDGRTWTVDKSVMAANPGVPLSQPAWGVRGATARIYFRAQPNGSNVISSAVLGLTAPGASGGLDVRQRLGGLPQPGEAPRDTKPQPRR